MIRIAAVDDNEVFLAKILDIINTYFKSRHIEIQFETYNSPSNLMWDLDEKTYFDIFLIDVEMPGMNGMEVAQQIRLKYLQPYLIFITSHAEFSIVGYEYDAFRYIMKDSVEEKLPLALGNIMEKMEHALHRQYTIETYSELRRIDYEDIYYLYVEEKYTYFYTRNGKFRERITLKKAYDKLNARQFVYIDKSHIVNLHHVIELGKREVVIRDKIVLPVSIPQLQAVKKAISDYWSEEGWN